MTQKLMHQRLVNTFSLFLTIVFLLNIWDQNEYHKKVGAITNILISPKRNIMKHGEHCLTSDICAQIVIAIFVSGSKSLTVKLFLLWIYHLNRAISQILDGDKILKGFFTENKLGVQLVPTYLDNHRSKNNTRKNQKNYHRQ